jgi:hypothetical protein
MEVEDPSKGKLRYLRPFIVLVPTLIVCIFNIVAGIAFDRSMWRLLFTVVFFYAVGTIAQKIVRKLMMDAAMQAIAKAREEQRAAEEEDEEDEDEDETEEDT